MYFIMFTTKFHMQLVCTAFYKKTFDLNHLKNKSRIQNIHHHKTSESVKDFSKLGSIL